MAKLMLLLSIAISSEAYSQPYYYYFTYNPSYDVPRYSGDIYRFNMADNSDEIFAQDVGCVTGIVFVNSDQTKIFIQERSSLFVMDAGTRQMNEVLYPTDEVMSILDSPQMNRYYLFIDNEDEEYEKTIVINRLTMQPIDTIDYSDETTFLSKDENYLYRLVPDSTGIFFSRFVLAKKKADPPVRCGKLGPFPTIVLLSDAKDGLALVNYENNTKYDFSALGYVLCDADKSITFTLFNFPWRSEGYLSSHGKYAIIEQVDYDTTRVGGEYYTGIVYVFNATTGELNQRLSLPPGGRILLFDDYPQMFYYYNDSTRQSVPVNLTTVTPTDVLIDTLMSLKHQAVANGWLRDSRGHGGDINEMMRGRDWYNESLFKQYEKWHPDENWDFDRDWNNGIVGVLDKRLDKAHEHLAKKDSVKARKDLEIFVMEVELLNNLSKKLEARGQRAMMTGEGYALLKYNAEYLINRLPERQGKGDEGEGRGRK